MTKKEVIKKVTDNNYFGLSEFEDDNNLKSVASGLYLNEHRWYSEAVNVYEVEDGFVGVKGVFQSFSENQTLEDINVLCTAFPMKQVNKPTYVLDE